MARPNRKEKREKKQDGEKPDPTPQTPEAKTPDNPAAPAEAKKDVYPTIPQLQAYRTEMHTPGHHRYFISVVDKEGKRISGNIVWSSNSRMVVNREVYDKPVLRIGIPEKDLAVLDIYFEEPKAEVDLFLCEYNRHGELILYGPPEEVPEPEPGDGIARHFTASWPQPRKGVQRFVFATLFISVLLMGMLAPTIGGLVLLIPIALVGIVAAAAAIFSSSRDGEEYAETAGMAFAPVMGTNNMLAAILWVLVGVSFLMSLTVSMGTPVLRTDLQHNAVSWTPWLLSWGCTVLLAITAAIYMVVALTDEVFRAFQKTERYFLEHTEFTTRDSFIRSLLMQRYGHVAIQTNIKAGDERQPNAESTARAAVREQSWLSRFLMELLAEWAAEFGERMIRGRRN